MKVVDYKHLPSRFPVVLTCTAWLMMDRLGAPVWLQAVIWTLVAMLWLLCLYGLLRQSLCEPHWKPSE